MITVIVMLMMTIRTKSQETGVVVVTILLSLATPVTPKLASWLLSIFSEEVHAQSPQVLANKWCWLSCVVSNYFLIASSLYLERTKWSSWQFPATCQHRIFFLSRLYLHSYISCTWVNLTAWGTLGTPGGILRYSLTLSALTSVYV